MTQILGLSGARASGKDSFAANLVEQGWVRHGFADSLYAEAAEAFGVSVGFLSQRATKEVPQDCLALAHCRDAAFVATVDQMEQGATDLKASRSPRFVLQVWGTEYRRSQDDLYWLRRMDEKLNSVPGTVPGVVITDVRYRNEAQTLKLRGGLLYRIRRTAIDAEMAQARAQGKPWALHSSEVEMLDYPFDGFIDNNGTLDDLRRQTQAFLSGLEMDKRRYA